MTVYLVGAGPGDPKLITVRGAELLQRAGAVAYGGLPDPRLLSLAPPGAELVEVGDEPDDSRATGQDGQEAANSVLVDLGRRHDVVVRLVVGDPFVLGRGGEEALALRAAGIDFEVVAGVPAATGEPETRPLFGWRVIVTRATSQASALVGRLADAGACPREFPVIAFADAADGGAALERALSSVERYEWVVFSSANAVERCWRHLRDARRLGGAKVAAIGEATAAALATRGVIADLVPERFVAESLVAAFPHPVRQGEGRVLVPCAAGARDVTAEGLRAKGWDVEVVEAYRTVRPGPGKVPAEALDGADAVTFTSSSTVSGFLEIAGHERVPAVVACIGPVTARTAAKAGLRVDVVPAVHTVDGLVDALVAWARHRSTQSDAR